MKGITAERNLMSRDILVICLLSLYMFVFLSGNLLPFNLTLLSIVTFFAYIATTFSTERVKLRSVHIGHLILLTFLLYGFLSVLWSDAPSYGFRKIVLTTIFVVIFGCFGSVFIRRIRTYFKIFGFFYALFVAVFIAINGVSVFEISSMYSRFNLTGDQNPIVVAYFFSFSLITLSSLLLWNNSKLWTNGIILFLCVFSFALSLLTGSKGPIIAMLSCGLIYKVLNGDFSFAFILKTGIFLAVLGVVLFYSLDYIASFNPVLFDFFEARFMGDNESSSSFSSRMDLYNLSWDKISSSGPFAIIFGQGSGSFGFFYTRKDEMMYPHNIFIEILFEYGIIGFILFVVMVLRVVYLNVFRNNVSQEAYVYMIFYFALIVAQFSRDMMGNSLIFVFYLYIEDQALLVKGGR